jgi:hypothetical protein
VKTLPLRVGIGVGIGVGVRAARVAAARLAFTVCLVCLSSGCFYSSTWGAQKASQKRNAVAATPASLGATERTSADDAIGDAGAPGTADDRVSTLRVRVHANMAYAAQTPDWKAHVGGMFAQASAILEPVVGKRLVLEAGDAWEHTNAAHLEGDLGALREEDTGEGVDLVVGLVGSLPVVTESFDQLGIAVVHGKHIVLRAPNVAGEYEAVERAFDQLSVEQRTRLRRQRIQHREVAVLLHEVGHALGARHHEVQGSLMRSHYDTKMSAFDPESIAQMKAPPATVASATVDAGGAGPAFAAIPAPEPAKDDTPTELAAKDRDAWRRASELSKAGDTDGAWGVAKPLFTKYAASYAVQDLRCKLAMARSAAFDQVRAECDALMKISTGR